MISAVDALKLPGAQLTSEEQIAADKLESDIEKHVRKNMRINGIDYKTDETRPVVIAEVNQRLKRAGWQPQWQALVEPNKFNPAAMKHVGFGLALSPSDAAFAEVFRGLLS